MKLELTKRDILLLKLTSCVLIAFVMVRFGLMPSVTRLQERQLEGQLLEERIEAMQALIDRIPALRQSVESRAEALEQSAAAYYEEMENRQVDQLLTGIALEHQLFPVSLSISEPQYSVPPAYLQKEEGLRGGGGEKNAGSLSPEDGAEERAEDGSDGSETAEITGDTSQAASREAAAAAAREYMRVVVGTMVLRGEKAELTAFLDDIAGRAPALRVCALRMNEKVYLDEDWNVETRQEMYCEIAVYMHGSVQAE